jgi:hypothetical protein
MKELTKGEIYLIENKINGKAYVGQACKFVSKNNNSWGTEGRWKSHIREAISANKDHCLLLNQAIRKYHPDNFNVTKLCDCNLDEMNEMEKDYIQMYNTLVPNGYNLNIGGANGKDSDETRVKKRDARLGKKHSEETKLKISKGQLGNRRTTNSSLPKYIGEYKKDGIVSGYTVRCFPIGIEEKEYISKTFVNSKNPQESFNLAIAYLEDLKNKYAFIKESATSFKALNINNYEDDIKKKLYSKFSENLPNNINPIIKDNKLHGYSVKNLKDQDNNIIPEKTFDNNTNRWNLDQAKKYIEQVDFIVKNKIKNIDWGNIDGVSKRGKTLENDKYLPKYINLYDNKSIKGYYVNGYPIKVNNKIKKYRKGFLSKSLSMEEKYNLAIDHLEELNIKYSTI